MEITIVSSLNGDEIHGTDNGKKTGCGINLQKYASKYMLNGKMTDLKELTCEKCKTNLAKKIIKADKKEMARIIKEERVRAKKGIEEEGIVPLGNTEAKITSVPEKNAQVEEPPKAPVQPQSASAPVQGTIPGTGIAIDSGLAAFAINVPKTENEVPKPQEGPEDDFLAQFAISKPQEQEEEIQPEPQSSAPPQSGIVHDDFLAQFAIPSPNIRSEGAPIEKTDEQPEAFENIAENAAEPEAPSYEMEDFTTEPEALSYEMDDVTDEPEVLSDGMDDFTVEPEENVDNLPENNVVETADKEDDIISDEDLVRMFSIMSGSESEGVVEVLPQDIPEANSIYDNDENVVDIEANEVTEESEDIIADEVSDDGLSEWDAVANSLFGVEAEMPSEPMPEIEVPTEPEPMPEIEVPAEPEPMPEIEAPTEPEPMPEIEALAEPEPMPEIEAPEEPEPMPEIEVPAEPEPMPEIEVPAEPEPMPEIEAPTEPEPMPEVEAPTEPEPMPEIEAPAEPEPMPEIEAPAEPEPMPEIEVPTEPEPMPEVEVPVNSKIEDVPSVQPIPVPQATTPMPGFVPPVQPAPEQPVIVPVPQFAGYDMNGQPVYTYVQSQFVGYDPNGQPIFVPLQQPVAAAPMQSAPMPQPTAAPVQSAPMPQPTAAPVQPAPMPQPMAAPVQPAPMMQSASAPVQPAAMPYQQNLSGSRVNISKIADEKPKSMPKTFANAVANSRAKSKQNIFDMQGAQMPVLDSIEDILSSMGDDSIKKKRAEEKAVPVFEEYKAPVRSASSAPKSNAPKPAEPERPLTKAELKAKKKQEKIDQKFKKDLAKRGF